MGTPSRRGSEANQRRSPGKTAAKGFQQYQLTRFDPAIPHPFVEGDGNGSRRGIAVLVEGQHHLVEAHAELLGSGADDAEVGLMRHQPVQLARLDAGSGKGIGHDFAQTGDRYLEDIVALHIHVGFELGPRHTATGLRQLE